MISGFKDLEPRPQTVCMIHGSDTILMRGSTWRSPDDSCSSSKPNILDVGRYNYDLKSSPFTVRNVSTTIRDECDAMIFSSYLHFTCPVAMSDFLAHLSVFQYAHVFNISINSYTRDRYCRCKDTETWLELFGSLPRHLRNIEILLEAKRGPARHSGDKQPRYLKSAHNKLWLLDQVLHRARRCAPDAIIAMGDWNFFPGLRRDQFARFKEAARWT